LNELKKLHAFDDRHNAVYVGIVYVSPSFSTGYASVTAKGGGGFSGAGGGGVGGRGGGRDAESY